MSIGDLLGENQRARVVVPAFQRGYSWDKKHVEAFWKDLVRFVEQSAVAGGPERYFLGPIVILSETQSSIDLLDGQQRIATATILFSVLRDIARSLQTVKASDLAADIQSRYISKLDKDGEDVGEYALQMGETDMLYFRGAVQAEPPTTNKPTLRSHRNINVAREFLKSAVLNRLGQLSDPEKFTVLKKLKLTLQRDLIMACIPVTSERDAFTIFETLNDRGLRLSVPDLLVNFLMRAATSVPERKAIRELWNEMLERMGTRDINRFLRHMWISKYGDLKKEDLFSALKDNIESKKINSMDFTKSCSEECEAYVQLLNAEAVNVGEVNSNVLLSVVRKLEYQPSFPLLLSAYRSLELDDFGSVVKWVLVYITRSALIGQLDPSGLETVLYSLAREVRKRMEPDSLQEGVTKKVASGKCAAYVKQTLSGNAPSDEDLVRSAKKVELSPDGASYLMNRLANLMQSATKEVQMGETNVEHIYPRNPEPEEWGGPENQIIMEPLTWVIGNLTIFGKRKNAKASNKEFDVKKSGYLNSEVQMTRDVSTKFSTWDTSSVMQRGEELAPLVAQIWNFDNPSRA